MNSPGGTPCKDTMTRFEGSPISIRFQGLAFCALAWLSLAASLWLPQTDVQTQLVLLLPIILVLGVPHGALDIVFARQLAGVRSTAGWCLFTIAYLAAAALVVVLWWFTPGFFLAAFLLVSVLHFSGDPEDETPALFRTLYGGAFIFCPLTLYGADVTQLFAFLAGLSAAQAIVAALQWATWPWIAAIGLAAIAGLKREPARSVELLSVAALLSFLPPLIGFTIFFCGMHSARHVLRTRDYSGARTLRHLLRIAVWPMLATVAGVALVWWLSDGKSLDMRLAQLLFVGLAALTVPHMIIVERVRFTGWVLGRNTPQEPVFHGATHDR